MTKYTNNYMKINTLRLLYNLYNSCTKVCTTKNSLYYIKNAVFTPLVQLVQGFPAGSYLLYMLYKKQEKTNFINLSIYLYIPVKLVNLYKMVLTNYKSETYSCTKPVQELYNLYNRAFFIA